MKIPKHLPAENSISPSAQSGTEIPPRFLNNEQAARHINIAPSTLKSSRSTGVLCGHPTPSYRKAGRKILYERRALDVWLDGLRVVKNTADFSSAKG